MHELALTVIQKLLMDTNEIEKFIQLNNGNNLNDFYNKTYEKLKDLNKRIDKLSLYLLVIVFLYFITSKAIISSFQVGPISISDISVITIILPILFAYLLLDLALTSAHKADVLATVKLLFIKLNRHHLTEKEIKEGSNDFVTRVLFPFSYSAEFGKSFPKKMTALGCFGTLLVLPMLSFILLPFYFEFYMLKEVYSNHYTSTLGIISFYLSIWIMLMVIYSVLQNIINSNKGSKTIS